MKLNKNPIIKGGIAIGLSVALAFLASSCSSNDERYSVILGADASSHAIIRDRESINKVQTTTLNVDKILEIELGDVKVTDINNGFDKLDDHTKYAELYIDNSDIGENEVVFAYNKPVDEEEHTMMEKFNRFLNGEAEPEFIIPDNDGRIIWKSNIAFLHNDNALPYELFGDDSSQLHLLVYNTETFATAVYPAMLSFSFDWENDFIESEDGLGDTYGYYSVKTKREIKGTDLPVKLKSYHIAEKKLY